MGKTPKWVVCVYNTVVLPACKFVHRVAWPKSPQDLAALVGAGIVVYGILQYDDREDEAREIEHFSFIVPRIGDLVPIDDKLPPESKGSSPPFMVGVLFTNKGNLPVRYSARILGLYYWDGDEGEITIPSAIDENKQLRSAFLSHNTPTAQSIVIPENRGSAQIWFDAQNIEGNEAFCVIYSVVFTPVLNSRLRSSLQEFRPSDYEMAVMYNAVQSAPALAKSKESAVARDVMYREHQHNCGKNDNRKEVLYQTYKEISDYDAGKAEAYRRVVELALPNFFNSLDTSDK